MKKSITKFISAVAAVSMLATAASVAVSADEPAVTPVKNTEASALYVADGTTTVADFAFAKTGMNYVFVPDSFVTEGTGNVAFLTEAMITDFVNKTEGLDVTEANEADVTKYIAKTIKFADKTEGWTDEELATVKEWFEKNLTIVGATKDEPFASAIVKLVAEYNKGEESKLDMSQKSKDNFGLWVAALPYNVTVIASEGSQAEAYAKGREALGMKFVIKGDANADGKLNVRDCAAVASALAKKATLPVQADYTLDAAANVRDAAAMANVFAHKK